MNKVFLIGRFTKDPDIRYSSNAEHTCVARFSLAVDRKYSKGSEKETDFINCVAFGKTAEFVEKWTHKGIKMVVSGRIQTGSYTNREGRKVYTTDVVVE